MKHVFKLTFLPRNVLPTALLVLSTLIAGAQGLYKSTTQLTTPERPVAIAFRQYLRQHETARQQGVSQFLQRNNNIRREYTDARGGYHFLHHIDGLGKPVYYQTRSNLGLATSINTNKLWSGGSLGLKLQGQGMEVSAARSRLGMWEPGPARTTHREFTGRAISRDTPLFTTANGNADHATHVAGTMIAAGLNPLARGMANQARLDCYEIQADEYTEMQTAAAEGMLVSNHSYGPDFDKTRLKLGVYDESCQTYDNLTFLNKNYLQFHAAGNDRDDSQSISYDILIGSANAKNIATVGAVKRLAGAGYTGPASVEMAAFSSYGPTDDGRIKPDFVAPGADIFSAYSASDEAYSSINGTSMASPGAAGSLFLLQQHYRNTKNAFMRASTLKGLAIHTADEAGSNPGPDYAFGWGLLNLEKAIAVINQTSGLQLLEEASLANNATYRKQVTTAGGPFKTTICWTDVPGTPLVNGGRDNRTPMLVNDLDVRLIDASNNQTVAQLPWKLDPANPTTAATRGDNVVDNVEQIFVENLPAGEYFIQVTHKGTLRQGPQEFSVFATNVASGGPVVKVNSTDPSASEGGGVTNQNISSPQSKNGRAMGTLTASDPGFIQFERSNTTGPLVVNYQIGGTATNGQDFTSLPTSVTFADGQSVLIEEIDPIEDDIAEGDETIIITLVDSDAYDPDPANITTTLTIKDNDTEPFSITGVTTVSCQTVSSGQRRLSFTPQYSGLNGQPVSFSVVNEMMPTTNAGPYTLNLYTDNPTITLKATQTGTNGEASYTYNWLSVCTGGGNTPPPVNNAPFSITGVTTVSCTTLSAGQRQLNFTPQYAGVNGQPITFQVINEMVPTTAPGPYTLNLYIDNPTITLKAAQAGTSGDVSYSYNWLSVCNGGENTPPPVNNAPFSITGVTTVSCTTLSAGQRQLQFTPRYAGVNGQPVSFSVVNEMLPTTNAGPYTLNLYTDNPTITLKATQTGTSGEASYTYNWLSVCGNSGSGRIGSTTSMESALQVRVIGNPAQNGQVSVEVRGAAGQPLRVQLTDMRGQIIGSHQIEQAGSVERHTFEIGRQSTGLLLLRATTSTQSQTVKVIKAD